MKRQLVGLALGVLLGAAGYAVVQRAAGEGHARGAKVKVLLEQALPAKLDGKPAKVTLVEVEHGPGGSSPRHRHPGPVVVYVLEGFLEAQVEGRPLKVYRKGQTFYEPPGGIHLVSRNPSKTRPVRFLAFLLTPRDARELVIPAKP